MTEGDVTAISRTAPLLRDGLLAVASYTHSTPTAAANGKVNISTNNCNILKLCRYPCLPTGVPLLYNYGHTGNIMDVQFAYDDKYVVTVGGSDSCVFQYLCKRK